MNAEEMSFKQALRALVDAERAASQDPVELDELVAYAEGALSPDQELRLREHLARHRDDTRLLLDHHDFPDLEPKGSTEPLSDDDVATQWRLLERRLRSEAEATGASTPDASVQRRSSGWWRRRSFSLAAGFVLGVLSMLVLVWQGLRDERPRPQLNVAVHDLFPSTVRSDFRDERRDEPAAATVLEIPARAEALLLAFNLADLRSFAAYRLRLATADGRELWTLDGLARGADGGFTVQLPRDQLAPGTYEAELCGLTATGGEELLGRYRFTTVFQE